MGLGLTKQEKVLVVGGSSGSSSSRQMVDLLYIHIIGKMFLCDLTK